MQKDICGRLRKQYVFLKEEEILKYEINEM